MLSRRARGFNARWLELGKRLLSAGDKKGDSQSMAQVLPGLLLFFFCAFANILLWCTVKRSIARLYEVKGCLLWGPNHERVHASSYRRASECSPFFYFAVLPCQISCTVALEVNVNAEEGNTGRSPFHIAAGASCFEFCEVRPRCSCVLAICSPSVPDSWRVKISWPLP